MISRLDKFDGPIFEREYIRGGGGCYIWDVNSVTYLGSLYTGGVLTGFYGNYVKLLAGLRISYIYPSDTICVEKSSGVFYLKKYVLI